MECHVFGDADADDLAFVLGWGNHPEDGNVRWLIDELARDYRVHAFVLRTNPRDFRAEWVDPVVEYVGDLDGFRLLGHSAGGLTASYVASETDPVETVLLSPFWGFPDGPLRPLIDLFALLPSDREFLPTGTDDPEAIGDLATEEQLQSGPDGAAPSFLRESLRAQATLPPVDDHVVFCTLTDPIVDVGAVGDRVPAENVVLYDGGHELFSSSGRERYVEWVRAALREGTDALPLGGRE